MKTEINTFSTIIYINSCHGPLPWHWVLEWTQKRKEKRRKKVRKDERMRKDLSFLSLYFIPETARYYFTTSLSFRKQLLDSHDCLFYTHRSENRQCFHCDWGTKVGNLCTPWQSTCPRPLARENAKCWTHQTLSLCFSTSLSVSSSSIRMLDRHLSLLNYSATERASQQWVPSCVSSLTVIPAAFVGRCPSKFMC